MKFLVGTDDPDALVDHVVERLREKQHEVELVETGEWPAVARAVGEGVASGHADQGVLFCWTGTGTSMAANKVAGVRAALAWDPWIAENARRWNDANVLVMSLKRTTSETADEIIDAWLAVSEPDADELDNIRSIERG